MTRVLLIAGGVAAAVIAALAITVKIMASELRGLKDRLSNSEAAKNEWKTQAERLERAFDIMKKNKDEANAKIDALDSGDAVDNAIGVLSKPKG